MQAFATLASGWSIYELASLVRVQVGSWVLDVRRSRGRPPLGLAAHRLRRGTDKDPRR